MPKLQVDHFAQIEHAEIEFGDLTVLVGPQASGKSLILQWLKMAIDHGEVVNSLKEAGHDVKSQSNILDLTFGEGMSRAWKDHETAVKYDGLNILPSGWMRNARKQAEGRVFFIPAHRALLLAEGWPAPFMKLNADTPVVARLFSQNLYLRFSGRQQSSLFPVDRILKKQYRDLIDEAVFHGGRIDLEKEGFRYNLRLRYEDLSLPFMTWTAGQREFTPLLLGLYHVLPPRQIKKLDGVDWVVIEEPEMGLHPRAISAIMMLVLELMWRGYRVVVSTHSPLILDIVWAIQRIHQFKGSWQSLAKAFRVENQHSLEKVLNHAIGAEYRAYFMDINPQNHRVTTRDISNLDPDSDDPNEADWGGLTGFSSRFGEAVSDAVNEAEE
jgi:energy-coupling factor transporter ATP-binding protein EcfA2